MDPIWEEIFRSTEWGKYPPEYVIRFVASNFYAERKKREVRLLDLGCGVGACTWYMAREGFRVSAIDGSPTAVDRADSWLKSESLNAEFRTADYTVLPWPDESFDGALDNVSFYCNLADEWQRAVDEVYRVLKPGGLFLSASFTPTSWGFGLGREVEPGTYADISEGPLKDRGQSHFVAESELRKFLSKFQMVNIDRESRTLCNQQKIVDLWIAVAKK